MEDLDFTYEYFIHIVGTSGKSYSYSIEADTDLNALNVAKEFFPKDYPEDEIRFMEILEKEKI